MTDQEVLALTNATDVYVTPHDHPGAIFSGTPVDSPCITPFGTFLRVRHLVVGQFVTKAFRADSVHLNRPRAAAEAARIHALARESPRPRSLQERIA